MPRVVQIGLSDNFVTAMFQPQQKSVKTCLYMFSYNTWFRYNGASTRLALHVFIVVMADKLYKVFAHRSWGYTDVEIVFLKVP